MIETVILKSIEDAAFSVEELKELSVYFKTWPELLKEVFRIKWRYTRFLEVIDHSHPSCRDLHDKLQIALKAAHDEFNKQMQ